MKQSESYYNHNLHVLKEVSTFFYYYELDIKMKWVVIDLLSLVSTEDKSWKVFPIFLPQSNLVPPFYVVFF
jgi:hypothetical protein